MSNSIEGPSQQPTDGLCIAVLGGDGRPHSRIPSGASARYFAAAGDGGNGEARRLAAALRSGTIDHVYILTRWNSHKVTGRIRRICKQLGIPVTLVP